MARWTGWLWRHARALAKRAEAHRLGLAAAGCAFYGLLALVPALSMVVSLFGLVTDPVRLEPHLDLVAPFLPEDGFRLLRRLIQGLTARPRADLGIALAIGAGVALWGASAGTKAMIAALNLAYDEAERRRLARAQGIALALTLGAILGALLALALLVALPIAAAFMGVGGEAAALLHAASLAVMLLYVGFMMAMLYRFGPCHRVAGRRFIWPGVGAAALIWLVGSALFSVYAERLAHFDATYGPLGALATVMLWLWMSAYAVLLGAELNAVLEIERG